MLCSSASFRPLFYFISVFLFFKNLFSNKISFLFTRSAGWITDYLLVFSSFVAYLYSFLTVDAIESGYHNNNFASTMNENRE